MTAKWLFACRPESGDRVVNAFTKSEFLSDELDEEPAQSIEQLKSEGAFSGVGVDAINAGYDLSHNSKRSVQQRELLKLEKRLCRLTGQAIVDFNMIEQGDKVMVCVSGGKDSYSLLDILLKLRERAPIDFDLIAVNLDQKQPGFPAEVLPKYLSELGVDFHIENQDTYSIVKDKIPEGKTMCSLCSRLRRGILYRVADELNCTKIALGHHRDDILQTFFLNMFYGAKLKSMPPKLVSDNGRHIVIRPLAYVAEEDLQQWAMHKAFPIIPCTLCGSQDNLQRQVVAQMLKEWERKTPGRVQNIFRALQNIAPSHLLDSALYDFKAISTSNSLQRADQGDTLFDPQEFKVDSTLSHIEIKKL